MTTLIFSIVLLLLAMAGVVVRKTYFYVPVHELKRRAEKGESQAAKFYRAAAYDKSLRGLLSLFIVLTAAGGFALLVRVTPLWISISALIILLSAAFFWLPASKLGRIGSKLTSLVTPLVSWLLNYLHPVLSKSTGLAGKRYSAPFHTGIFERNDLLKLIEKQQHQPDNRLSEEELEIAKRALQFADHKVQEVLTPAKNVKTVIATETVGPVLIDELHKADQEYVLVKDKPKGMIVGALELKDLGLHSSGTVQDMMDPKIYYVHENDTLSEVLHAFYTTNHPLFVVVNSFEEFIGIISVENILQQLLGHIPGDDFDQYADVAAVAARHNKVEKLEDTSESDDVIEVSI